MICYSLIIGVAQVWTVQQTTFWIQNKHCCAEKLQ